MLIIPTSLDSAIIVEVGTPFLLQAVGYSALTCGALCVWEMVMATVLGSGPRGSRWAWLGAAATFLVLSAIGSGTMFGDVTFNESGSEWVSTTWGSVLGGLGFHLFAACVFIVLGLRAGDVLRARRAGGFPSFGVWTGGVAAMVAYAAVLAQGAEQPDGSVFGTVTLGAGIALAVAAVGSLLGVVVIRGLRARTA